MPTVPSLYNIYTFVTFSPEPKLRVGPEMPAHYPSFYDYSDVEISNNQATSPTVISDTGTGTIIIALTATALVLLSVTVTTLIWSEYKLFAIFLLIYQNCNRLSMLLFSCVCISVYIRNKNK